MRRTYPTDLSDAEWGCLEPHLPAPKATGRPRVYPLREIINAIFYLLRSGCSWRLLPHDFPPWRSVYHCFRQFRLDGTWERLHAALRERVRRRTAWLRRRQEGEGQKAALAGRYGRILAQSQGPQRQGDGLRWHQGSTGSCEGTVPAPCSPVAGRRLHGRRQGWRLGTEDLGWKAEIVSRPRKPAPEEVLMKWAKEWAKEGVKVDWQKLMPPRGFVVLPRRWVVERTFSWLG